MAKVPTLEEIIAKRTGTGGWPRAQLAEWGVPWPPPKGWQRALVAGKFDLQSYCDCGHQRAAHEFSAEFSEYWLGCVACKTCIVFNERKS